MSKAKLSTHPLAQNDKWVFSQPHLEMSGQLLVSEERAGVRAQNTCREALIGKLYDLLVQLCTQIEPRGPSGWQVKKALKARADCLHPSLFEQFDRSRNYMSIQDWILQPNLPADKRTPDFWTRDPGRQRIEAFYEVADLICGNTLVLLDAGRRPGKHYLSTPADRRGNLLYYYGGGTTLFQHWALMAVALGLLRQAAMLVRAEVCEEVRKAVPRAEVLEALTTNDHALALHNLKRALPWICVPPPIGDGATGNSNERAPNYVYLPFPDGYQARLLNLVMAVKRGGLKAFGPDMVENWGLMRGDRIAIGIWGWLGVKENGKSAEEKRIEALAKEGSAA